jgi:hypothetical protein
VRTKTKLTMISQLTKRAIVIASNLTAFCKHLNRSETVVQQKCQNPKDM